MRFARHSGWMVVLAVALCAAWVFAGQQELPDAPQPQQNTPQQNTSQQPNVPDAPSATRPATPFPAPSPGATSPAANPPEEQAPPAEEKRNTPAPPAQVTTAPPGSAPENGSARDQMFTLVKNVNFVSVPVTVKDPSGHLVNGLLKKDFAVLEDGADQPITFFTSDPFPLSAALVVDLGMSDTTVSKINETLPALIGAFGQFDEVSIYTYGNTVQKVQDFTAAVSDRLTPVLSKMKTRQGRSGGVPVTSGPLASGPTVNSKPVDPNVPPIRVAPRESRVLNDAILAAAQDLARRDPTRRKIVFVISDGRELGSKASYTEVRKMLLSNGISVYATAVGSSAIPGYGTLAKIPFPGQGYGDILPKYASATGGQVFTEFGKSAIEAAYARVTDEARNQYTLGYTARATTAGNYRGIEVLVHRPKLKVYAKDGYFPLPVSK